MDFAPCGSMRMPDKETMRCCQLKVTERCFSLNANYHGFVFPVNPHRIQCVLLFFDFCLLCCFLLSVVYAVFVCFNFLAVFYTSYS